eukprot:3273468-Prymnesium_polylepis.2
MAVAGAQESPSEAGASLSSDGGRQAAAPARRAARPKSSLRAQTGAESRGAGRWAADGSNAAEP